VEVRLFSRAEKLGGCFFVLANPKLFCQNASIMRIVPGTRNIVIAAITALCIIGAFVFAMAQPKSDDAAPLQLVIQCANGKTKDDLSQAIGKNQSLKDHKERYILKFDDVPVGAGGAHPVDNLVCDGNKSSSRVTQLANFVNSSDLKQFLTDAGIQ
jgi:hypothetical protein